MAGELPVTFDGERVVVGAHPATVAHRIGRSCPHGTHPTTVVAEYGPGGNLAYVEATYLDSTYRAYVGRYQDMQERAPKKLRVEAAGAVLHWTDRWWDDDEAPVRQPGDPVWYGVDVDLVGGHPTERDYDDFFPFSNCDGCQDQEGLLRFGICISMSGRIHGLFLEADSSDLPRPANSTPRTNGVWPLNEMPD